ncbi:MAG: SRPBCC domain-containing protein [Pseudolysinimonas sp.]
MTGIEATADLEIAAGPEHVWGILTDNDAFGEVMFGSEIVTDWKVGSPILFRGTWEGKPFEDKGEILELDPPRRMRVTHYSPLSGEKDAPENYHEVRYDLAPASDGTRVTITQDNNPTQDAADHSTANWQTMLESLKKVAER